MGFSQFISAFLIMAVLAAVLCILAIYSVTLPIDEGQELSRLATAGVLRGAA